MELCPSSYYSTTSNRNQRVREFSNLSTLNFKLLNRYIPYHLFISKKPLDHPWMNRREALNIKKKTSSACDGSEVYLVPYIFI
jgi:hypothetical protein